MFIKFLYKTLQAESRLRTTWPPYAATPRKVEAYKSRETSLAEMSTKNAYRKSGAQKSKYLNSTHSIEKSSYQ